MRGQQNSAPGSEGAHPNGRHQAEAAGGPVVVQTPDRRLSGRALDLREWTGTDVDAEGLVAAVRHNQGDSDEAPADEAAVLDPRQAEVEV
jgi:hypothetical protein